MATSLYLAMTAAEIASKSAPSSQIAWMACHFSPYSTGLTNLPGSLPEGAILILNDITPIHGHDPERIALQLRLAIDALDCSGILLDFQRPGVRETTVLAKHLSASLPCPVAISDVYAEESAGPVFLSPCPHHMPLTDHLAPWAGREVWLDLAADAQAITLTKEGSTIHPLPLGEIPQGGHWDQELSCHYAIQNKEDSAVFQLWRTKEDLAALADTAGTLGVKTLVGLYQELGAE